MGARNTLEQQRAYNAALRERRKAGGLLRKEIWVHPEDWPEIQAVIDERARRRGKGDGVTHSPDKTDRA